MNISNSLKNAVLSKNLTSIRDALWSSLCVDKAFSDFTITNFDYCFQNGISEDMLYETHDGKPIDLEVSKDNYSLLMGQLRTNFSRERINKLKEMGRILYPVSTSATDDKKDTSSFETNRASIKKEAPKTESKNDTSSDGIRRSSIKKETPKENSDISLSKILIPSVAIAIVVIILAMLLKK